MLKVNSEGKTPEHCAQNTTALALESDTNTESLPSLGMLQT